MFEQAANGSVVEGEGDTPAIENTETKPAQEKKDDWAKMF